MKLSKRNMLSISFMLFSMFFGAGNLIFPPFMGQSAGNRGIPATVGFLLTAVVLPILAVVVVSKYDGLDKLGEKVGKRFAIAYTILVYISIGPGVAIPRAASVPFEMAVAPYLPEGTDLRLWLLIYSAVFFAIALAMCLRPNKLVDWLGIILTPCLLLLLIALFVGFLFRGKVDIAQAQAAYQKYPFLQGFAEGYNTLDVMAGLNFGLVIMTTLNAFGVGEKKQAARLTLRCGAYAGAILALVYLALTYMGACSSGAYEPQANGALILRLIAEEVFGLPGAILLAAIFTLACLTTCVGLINSISQYFASLFRKVSYKAWVLIITGISFLLSNMGMSLILSISVPILNAIYPTGIMLILLGLSGKLWENRPYVFPLTALASGVVSLIFALSAAGLEIPFVTGVFRMLPLFDAGFGWLIPTAVLFLIGALIPDGKKDTAKA